MVNTLISGEPLPRLFVIKCPYYCDHRGDFVKFFHLESLHEHGIFFNTAEMFLTRSKAGVLRGMHYQVGIAEHDKLVFCARGRVLDVVVDVRPQSPFFNRPFAIELSEFNHTALLIGSGYAHGFLSLEEESWMHYSTTTVHNPSLDAGVLWSSIDFEWPLKNPIISLRDQQHPSLLDL